MMCNSYSMSAGSFIISPILHIIETDIVAHGYNSLVPLKPRCTMIFRDTVVLKN
jgi:hypothetical protein